MSAICNDNQNKYNIFFEKNVFLEKQALLLMIETEKSNAENLNLRKEIMSLRKEKESVITKNKKIYKNISSEQNPPLTKKTLEKVVNNENKSKDSYEGKKIRWSDEVSDVSDDDSDNEMSAKAKKSKTKKPAKTVAERRLMNELAKKAKNISHDYELFEKEFLAFLKQNTEDNKLPSKMIMNFKKGENIFRIIGFVPFYTPEALSASNSKRALKNEAPLIGNDFDFAERFSARSKERNERDKIGFEYELTLCGSPYQAQITRKNI